MASLGICALAAPAVPASLPSGLPGVMAYLPATGPPPLRYQAPRPVSRVALALLAPSTNKLRPVSGGSSTSAGPAALTAAANTNASPTTAVTLAAESAPAPEGPLLPAIPLPTGLGAPPNAAVDPQMILEYLLPQTNNSTNHTKVILPVFIPPAGNPPARSSQATYQSR